VNFIFAAVVISLAGVALASMYLSMDKPVIQDAAAPDPGEMKLPENHLPMNVASRLTELEKLSAGDPQNPDYKTEIGNAYYDLGDYKKAIIAYTESLKLRPQDPGVETDLATSYHFLGQDDKALDLLNKVLQYRPDFPQALFNKGIVLIDGKRDTAGGIAVWQRLLESNPGFPQRAQVEQKIRELQSSAR
jgi:cytochrome c-type biogenesis protein CcmH/NrfG